MRGKRGGGGGSDPAEPLTTARSRPRWLHVGCPEPSEAARRWWPPALPCLLPERGKEKASWEGRRRSRGEHGIPGMAPHGAGAAAGQWPSWGALATPAGQRFPAEQAGMPSHGLQRSGMAGMGKGRGAAGVCTRPRSPWCSSHGAGSAGCGENIWKRANFKKRKKKKRGAKKNTTPISNGWKYQ